MTKSTKLHERNEKKERRGDRFHGDALSSITDVRKRRALRVLVDNGYERGRRRKDGSVIAAAAVAGVSKDTIYDWLDDPSFGSALEALLAEEVHREVDNLRRQSAKGNVAAAIFRLKVLKPEIYDDQLRRELTIIDAKNRQLESLLEKHPVPTLNFVASADVPPPPPELLPFLT